MNCKFKTEFDGICTNGDCPRVGDFCPLSDDCEICVYQDGRNLIKEIAELKAKLETQRQRGQELIIHAMLNKGKNPEGSKTKYEYNVIPCAIYGRQHNKEMFAICKKLNRID